MFVSELHLKNFRNYKEENFRFSDGVNIFTGDNGQGKTNALEALFLVSVGKSFRAKHDDEMILHGEKEFSVDVKYFSDYENKIKINFSCDAKKRICVNGIYIKRLGELMGEVPSVIFTPYHLRLLNDGPQERRKFLDIAICQIYPVYYYDLQHYNKIIKNKNSFLREVNPFNYDKNLIDVWNLSLAEYAFKIYNRRREYIEKFSLYASKYHEEISNGKEILKFNYKSCVREFENAESFYAFLSDNTQKEIDRRISLYGTHKDDIEIKLSDGMDIKIYGSQGQQRTCVLAMKFAETKILEDMIGRKPILLLDDVLSELDEKRQQKLLKNMEDTQIFVTGTDEEALKNAILRNKKTFLIKNGHLVF